MSLTCPACGGKMELGADGKQAECPYCGHVMLIEKEDPARKAYELHMAKGRAEADIQRQQEKRLRRRQLKGWFIAFCVIAAICLINVAIPGSPMHDLAFPHTVDPFTAVSVRFSGMSGEGRAELQISDRNAEYTDAAKFEVTPDTGLSNGDAVTVKAQAPLGWRFDPSEKQFTVEGLTEWVTSTNQLGGDNLVACSGYDLYSLPDVPVHFGREHLI